MAYYVANQTGNLSTAGTWDTVTNTPTLHAANNVAVATSAKFTATFTAPNTTNKSTGAVMLLGTRPTASTNITVTLQEDIAGTATWADVAGATATFNYADFPVTLMQTGAVIAQYIYFRWTTPYTFATTGANRYRLKWLGSAANGNMGADSGGTLAMFFHTDDRHTAPTTGDQLFVMSHNGTGGLTVTNTGSSVVLAAGADTTTRSTVRTLGAALYIGGSSTVDLVKLKMDTAASSTLNPKGQIIIMDGGNLQAGTDSVPYPTGLVATVNFDVTGAATVNSWAGIIKTKYGKIELSGEPKPDTTKWKARYVSGLGTAASPLTVSINHGWAVGDEIVVSATNGTSQTEYRYIISIPAANQLVLSNTAGGAENALTSTHSTDAHVLNIQRNVLVTTSDATRPLWFYGNFSHPGTHIWKWSRFHNTGQTDTDRTGLTVTNNLQSVVTMDYNVVSRVTASAGGITALNNVIPQTWTGNIQVGGTGTRSGMNLTSCVATTLNDNFHLGTTGFGVNITTSYACTLNRCVMADTNSAGSNLGGGLNITNSQITVNDSEITRTRNQSIYLSGAINTVFNNCEIGSFGAATGDGYEHLVVSNTYNDILWDNCNFGSATFLQNYLNAARGSEFKAHNYNSTDNRHIWYTPSGVAQSTGTSLADTTVRTTSSLGVRLAPQEATIGLEWSFLIPARAQSVVGFTGYFQKNVAFGTDVAIVEMYLPGNLTSTPDASYTLPNTTGTWLPVNIVADYTGTVSALATIKIIARSATAAAYLYADDFYNAGDGTTTFDQVTGLDVWYQGKPIPVIAPQTPSAADIASNVWAVQTSTLTAAGTTGKVQKDASLSNLLIRDKLS